ncbi:MAG TPA: LysM peptidoglycan-binding domain-containing protein [Burkholderiales bacterium]
MFKSSTALLLALALAAPVTWAAKGNVLQVQPDAPDRYVVVKGDTLWDISGRFLKDPWRWPEIWGLNKAQIKDPHWIYPGDTVIFDRANMKLLLQSRADGNGTLAPRVRETSLDAEPVPTIPAKMIDPFLSQPLVVEKDGLDKAPRIVATEEGRVNLGVGNVAYVEGLGDSTAEVWNVYRPGAALVDPETEETLGYEAIYLGTARVVKAGEPAKLKIVSAQREIGEGDRLVAAEPPSIFHYVPHAPENKIRARVMSLYNGRTDARTSYYSGKQDHGLKSVYGSYEEAGPLSMITLNVGASDGIEPGHVLALQRGMVLPRDRSVGPWYLGEARPKPVVLPEERYGLAMVFRVFENLSYALIVQAERQVAPGDRVSNP